VTVADEPAPAEEDTEEATESTAEDESLAEDVERENSRDSAVSPDESEGGRRRRRRRRRRSGDRAFGESLAADAPQPTDDGLAVVAEIGGDLAKPIGEPDSFDRKAPERGRRSRRSRGGRNRFSPRPNDGSSFGETGTPTSAAAHQEPSAAAETDRTSPSTSESVGEREAARPAETVAAAAREPVIDALSAAAGRDHEESAPTEVIPAVQERPAPPAAQPEPGPDSTPSAEEPPRPRRNGWWQRARASIVGD
jgi:ribonuclease E